MDSQNNLEIILLKRFIGIFATYVSKILIYGFIFFEAVSEYFFRLTGKNTQKPPQKK